MYFSNLFRANRKALLLSCLAACLLLGSTAADAKKITVSLSQASYGFTDASADTSFCSRFALFLDSLRRTVSPDDKVTIKLEKRTYHLYANDAAAHEVYVSNHDQNQPKRIGICLNGWQNLTLDGRGAELMCHGRMLPLALMNSKNCTIKDLSVDFENPQISQVEILSNDSLQGITFRAAPWVKHRINREGNFEVYGEDWAHTPAWGIAFEKESRHIIYRTADIGFDFGDIRSLGNDCYLAPRWKDQRLPQGTIVAMRSYFRPAPGFFLAENENTLLKDIQIHYAEGMGLIAQRCTDITLDHFSVCLRGKDDPRYFTTQADATHFSQCRGKITSVGGLYEGMMDDAINVHGIYLKVIERIDDFTLRLAYGHSQTWGFAWGDTGDSVQFIDAKRMQNVGSLLHIRNIRPADRSDITGCKEFIAEFEERVPTEVQGGGLYGIENMNWVPEVYFARNVIRNNRARGALFSSPLRTVCEKNLFDHTSGSAIVLCGDCNGWFESGAVRDLVIRKNKFVNALTSLYQFTNAVISIYPEIPNLAGQTASFHGGPMGSVLICDNVFHTFDEPLLYAKSISGLRFVRNKVIRNHDFPPYHFINTPVLFEQVRDSEAPGYITTPPANNQLQ